jgi:hypothetical protein
MIPETTLCLPILMVLLLPSNPSQMRDQRTQTQYHSLSSQKIKTYSVRQFIYSCVIEPSIRGRCRVFSHTQNLFLFLPCVVHESLVRRLDDTGAWLCASVDTKDQQRMVFFGGNINSTSAVIEQANVNIHWKSWLRFHLNGKLSDRLIFHGET